MYERKRNEPHVAAQEKTEIAALRLENENLSRQVRQLIESERKRCEDQKRLDAQLKEYQDLYELNRKLIVTSDLRTIFKYAAEYIIHKLGYERAIFFQQSENTGDYTITAIDGYNDQQEKRAVSQFVISAESSLLSRLQEESGVLICREDTEQHDLAALRAEMLMNELLFYRLGSDSRPLALLALGNTAERAHLCRRVSDFENGVRLGIGNLAGLLSRTIVRKRDEQEILRLNAELEMKIVQLQEAQEELVRKEKLAILGQLSGSVGHELRNPLGVMSNAVYFLKMVLADADVNVGEYLDIIKKEIDNSLRIIADLLDFARTKTPQIKTMAVQTVIGEILGRCIIPENITIERRIPDNLPLLRLDPLQIGQVLQNLITNGIQAMPDGGTLSISARFSGAPAEEPLQQDCIEIAIADTGEGITPENMKKIFQPLFTTKARGIGLGLVVCRNLAEANGGRIAVSSEPGQGTVFTVELPVCKSQ